MTIIPVALFWLLAVWASISRRPALLYLFFISTAFGTFAVVPPELTGGLTFTAAPIIALLIVLRAFANRKGPDEFLTFALRPGRLGLLFFFWVVAIIATLFLPSVFADKIAVVPIRGVLSETSALEPTAQNISQLVYMSISILSVFAFARILRSGHDRQIALSALVVGGGVVALTGLIDFSTQYLPIEPLLAPFRTATYALATGVEVLDGKRVVGLMPEASAFGGLSLTFLSLLVFFRRAIVEPRLRNFYAPVVIGALLLCCYLSKSSGAYLGLGVLILVIGVEAILRSFSRGQSRQIYRQDLLGEISIALGLFVLAAFLVILQPSIIEPVFELFDRMVLQKTESNSFSERGMWRSVAWESVLSSNGFGIGLGSTRSSSSLAAIFSGTGIIGGLLYCGFLLQTLLRRSSHMNSEGQFILSAFRFSFIPSFVLALLVGSADFGPLAAFAFGIVTATVFSRSNQAMLREKSRKIRKLPVGHKNKAHSLDTGDDAGYQLESMKKPT